MFKLKSSPNRVCQIEVVGEWVDPVTNLEYDFLAKVIVSRDYDIEAVDFLAIEVYDGDVALDEDVAYILANHSAVKSNLEAIAGEKAIEKVQSEDFSAECERE